MLLATTKFSLPVKPLLASLLAGSQESLGRSDKSDKRRKDKERNSVYIDRSHSESAKDKTSYEKRMGKNHKRQRSWAGNKLLDIEGKFRT